MNNGIVEWPSPSEYVELAWFEVRDDIVRDVRYSPTMNEIELVCGRYRLDFDMIREAIVNKSEGVYGFLIDAERHRESLRSSE